MRVFSFFCLLLILVSSISYGNRMKIIGHNPDSVLQSVEDEDTLTLFLTLNLDDSSYNAISCYIKYDTSNLSVIDQNASKIGTQPFMSEGFFKNSTLLSNTIMNDGVIAYTEANLFDSVSSKNDTLCSFKFYIKDDQNKEMWISFDTSSSRRTQLSRTSGASIIVDTTDSLLLTVLPEPVTYLSISDVTADSGGIVKLNWVLSEDEPYGTGYIDGYWLYRKKNTDSVFSIIDTISLRTFSTYDTVDISEYKDTIKYQYFMVAFNEHTFANGEKHYTLSNSSDTVTGYGLDNVLMDFDLLTPVNDSIIQQSESQGTRFAWNRSIDPDQETVSYLFMIADDSLFQQVQHYINIQNDTSYYYKLSPFENQTIYWKVIAYDNDNFSKISRQYNKIVVNLLDEIPTAPSIISPIYPNIIQDSAILFKWYSSEDGDPFDTVVYTMIIDTSVVFLNPKTISGITDTFYQLNELLVDDDVQYWKVIAEDINGNKDTSSLKYFHTSVVPEKPGPFTILSPDENETFEQPSINLRFTTSVETDLFDSVDYYIYYNKDDSMSFANIKSTRDTSIIISGLDDNSIYYLKVEAIDKTGLKTQASPGIIKFAINKYNTSPSTFSLLEPDSAYAVLVDEGEIIMKWNQSTDNDPEDTVRYRILTGSTTSSMQIYQDSLLDTVSIFEVNSLYEDKKNYWKVEAFDKSGNVITSTQKEWFFYKNATNSAPFTFNLLQPAETSVQTTLSPFFTWEASIDMDLNDTIRYLLTIYDSSYSVLDSIDGIMDTFYQYTGSLTEDAAYYWDVAAKDGSGAATGSYQSYSIFYVNSQNTAPESFNLLLPQKNAQFNELTQTFSWTQSIDTDYGDQVQYKVYFSNSINFTSYDSLIKTDTTNLISLDFVSQNQPVYWKVAAYDQNGEETVSDSIYSFWIDSQAPQLKLILAENRILTDYLKIFVKSSEKLSSTPDLVMGYSNLTLESVDTAANIYFSSYKVTNDSINTLSYSLSGTDIVGNDTTFSNTLYLSVGKMKLAKIGELDFSILDNKGTGYYIIQGSEITSDFFFSPLKNDGNQLKLIVNGVLYHENQLLPVHEQQGTQSVYQVNQAGYYRIEHNPVQMTVKKDFIQVYPNPVSDRLRLKYFISEEIEKTSSYQFTIYNVIGEKIADFEQQAQTGWIGEMEMNLRNKNISSGIYLLVLFKNKRVYQSKQFLYLK